MFKREKREQLLAFALLLPSILFLLIFVAYPMITNIIISLKKVSINIMIPDVFIGIQNYSEILKDPNFYNSLGVTLLYTFFVVAGSTILGLLVAILFNREFRFRNLARSLIILSYVAPSISLIFSWKYMFNTNYGIINYLIVDVLKLVSQPPLWFDQPSLSFVMVVLFAIWRYYPYAFISFLAILQTIDRSLYEAAEMDGASAWQRFKVVTLPAIKPVLITVVTLRTIWMFYMYADVSLLTNQVNILGIYLYKTAFASNDLGKAAAISVILFVIIFGLVFMSRKKVEEK